MARRASDSSSHSSPLPMSCSGRCSPGGATIVRQLPEALACDSATWARLRSISRASSSVPTTWKA